MQHPVLNTVGLTSVIKNSMAIILWSWFYSQTLIDSTPLTVDTHDVMDSSDSLIYLWLGQTPSCIAILSYITRGTHSIHDCVTPHSDHMTVVCGKCRSPSLAGLCQHLPSAVSQQYLHVPGLLQCEGLYHPTEYSVGACVFMCACRGTTSRH